MTIRAACHSFTGTRQRSLMSIAERRWCRFQEVGRRFLSTPVDEEEPPSKNVGQVVGAWVFCRHGDRTPSRPLCPAHRQEDESHFWLTKLPYPSTASAYKDFSASFPPLIDDPTGVYFDVHRNPYGFLTHKGLLQCRQNGRELRERYDLGIHHLASDEHFLKTWRISAYSTNYLRTVLSVQSLLDGLLNTNLYNPESTREDMDYTKMSPREWPVPDHNFIQTNYYDEEEEEYNREGYGSDWEADPRNNVLNLYLERDRAKEKRKPKVFVRVRDQSCDNLNAFDRNPDLMRDLVSDVMQSPSFQQEDATAAMIAARLANILPGLARKGRKDFSARTPSGINWVEAADHFVCRTSHELQLSKFSDHEHDANVEQMLSAMTYKALGHLAWRFRQWYQNPQLLAAIAAPPLREIAQQLEHIVLNQTRSNQKVRALQDPHANFLCIYSCHDVTLLSLLYALGADFLADESSAVWREYWPEYASTLVIELVRLEEQDADNTNQHIIRVMINGRVVISTDFLLSKFEREKTGSSTALEKEKLTTSNPLGEGPYNLLTTENFWGIVTRLESMGEYDFSQWPAMKEEAGPGQAQAKKPLRTGSLNSSLN